MEPSETSALALAIGRRPEVDLRHWRAVALRRDPLDPPAHRFHHIVAHPVAADARTNKYSHPLWHQVSKHGSQPANSLAYAEPVDGMMPASPGAEAEPLHPGTEYRLVVEARRWKGEHDFQIPAQGR